MTLSKICELQYFATLQWLRLLPLRKILCIIAKLSKVLKPKKNQAVFLNRLIGLVGWAAVWPCAHFLGPVRGVGIR